MAGKVLNFYIKNPEAADSGTDAGSQKEKGAEVDESSKYVHFSYEITELKDGCSADLKQRHYTTVIEGLLNALYTILDDLDYARENMNKSEMINEADPEGYQFRSTSMNW